MKYRTHCRCFGMETDLCDREDDAKWPKRNKDGRQELEIRLGNEHISFDVTPPSPHIQRPLPKICSVFVWYRTVLGYLNMVIDLGDF